MSHSLKRSRLWATERECPGASVQSEGLNTGPSLRLGAFCRFHIWISGSHWSWTMINFGGPCWPNNSLQVLFFCEVKKKKGGGAVACPAIPMIWTKICTWFVLTCTLRLDRKVFAVWWKQERTTVAAPVSVLLSDTSTSFKSTWWVVWMLLLVLRWKGANRGVIPWTRSSRSRRQQSNIWHFPVWHLSLPLLTEGLQLYQPALKFRVV